MKPLLVTYSILSGLLLPFLLYLQVFSVFLFDSGVSVGAYVVSGFILLIPILLIVGNIFAWKQYKKGNTKKVIFYMIMPILYPILFFTIWLSLDAANA